MGENLSGATKITQQQVKEVLEQAEIIL